MERHRLVRRRRTQCHQQIHLVQLRRQKLEQSDTIEFVRYYWYQNGLEWLFLDRHWQFDSRQQYIQHWHECRRNILVYAKKYEFFVQHYQHVHESHGDERNPIYNLRTSSWRANSIDLCIKQHNIGFVFIYSTSRWRNAYLLYGKCGSSQWTNHKSNFCLWGNYRNHHGSNLCHILYD